MASNEVELTENDIPGASLEEPLESATILALKRWLLCHGIQVSTSLRKPKLIERYDTGGILIYMNYRYPSVLFKM